MRTLAVGSSRYRTIGFGAVLAALLAVPILGGLAVGGDAPRGADRLPAAAADTGSVQAQSTADQLVTDRPIGQVPASLEEALARGAEGDGSIARVNYEYGSSGTIRIDNGGVIPLGDGLEVEVSLDPYPPADFDIAVTYTLRGGRPITDAAVATSWDMVFMYHGPFETVMPHAGDGRYEASYDFFMFGPWELQTRLELPDHDPIDFAVSIYVWPTG